MSASEAMTALKRARSAAGMSQGDVCRDLARERQKRNKTPPKPASLKRMYTDWEMGRVLPLDWRDELCAVLKQPPEALDLPVAASGPALRVPAAADVAQPDGDVIPAAVQLPDPRQPLTQWLTDSNTSDETIERLDQAAVSLAEAHTQIPPQRALKDVLRVHHEAKKLLQGRKQRLRQARELVRIEADLLAHVCLLLGDLGRNERALQYGEVSLLCAREAGTSEAKAWTVQAKTARWQGRYAESADFASRGFACSPPEPIRVQLAYQEANAAAFLGDSRRAQRALRQGEQAAEELVLNDSGVSAWSFPATRQALFALSVATHTGDPDAALSAAATADEHWAAGTPQVPATWAQVRFGAGIAHLVNDELDGAAEQILPVLNLPPELRVSTVTGYTTDIYQRLHHPRFEHSTVGAELRSQLRDFNAGAKLNE